jgi:hypothetical protein
MSDDNAFRELVSKMRARLRDEDRAISDLRTLGRKWTGIAL